MKTKIFFITLIVISLILGGLDYYSQNRLSKQLKFVSNIDTSTWKTYTNNKYGFEFMYPAGWQKVSEREDSVIFITSYKNQIYFAVSHTNFNQSWADYLKTLSNSSIISIDLSKGDPVLETMYHLCVEECSFNIAYELKDWYEQGLVIDFSISDGIEGINIGPYATKDDVIKTRDTFTKMRSGSLMEMRTVVSTFKLTR